MLIPYKEVVQLIGGERPKTILHVGAHEGEELTDYRTEGVEQVIFIEALPDKARALADRVRNMPGIIVICACAAQADNLITPFHVTNNGQSSSMLPLGTHETEHPEVKVVRTFRHITRTVDTIFKEKGLDPDAIDLANLDVQGAELQVLHGMRTILPNLRAVYCEVNEKELYKTCGLVEEVDALLAYYNLWRVKTQWSGHGWGDSLFIRG